MKKLLTNCLIHNSRYDPDESVIDGSEFGRWLDPHYTDMHQLWFNSKYDKSVMDEDMVKKNAKSQLILEP
jgi:Rieske Fe-S protein